MSRGAAARVHPNGSPKYVK